MGANKQHLGLIWAIYSRSLCSGLGTFLYPCLPDLNHSEPLSAVSEAISSVSSLLPLINDALVRTITASPLKQIKGVLEIPRMYRRTNREPPRKPCPYVVNISTSLATFASSNSHTGLAGWLRQAKDVLLVAYQEQVRYPSRIFLPFLVDILLDR